MRFWKKRKTVAPPQRARLMLERLEDRSMLTVGSPVAIVSGVPTWVTQPDGKDIRVELMGPGKGSYTVDADGSIDTLTLTGTGLRSTLMINAYGRKSPSTTIDN